MALKSRSEFARFSVFLMAVVLVFSGCAATSDHHRVGMDREQPDYSASAYSGVSQTLEQFGSDAAYLTYLDQRDRRPSAWWYYRRLRQGIGWKSIQEVEDPLSDCPVYDPDNPACFDFGDEVGEDMIVVTASRATSPTIQTSITNNQVAVVDEGGVVKRIGDRVIVLRDGRLFILNIGEGENAEPVLESRVDLYDDRDEGTWFDELLVSDKRIVVIGFSYEYDASSYSVYDLSDGGEVSFVGRFLVSSEDYFDGASYAARMIGDDIVFEFPIDLFALDPEETTAPSFFKPDRDGDGEPDDVFPLVDAADVYRPVTDHEEPVVQAFVKCELEALALRGPDGACQRVAFISGDRGQFYIGPTAAYFWSNAEVNIHQRGEDCLLETFNEEGATPAHRIDLETMELSVAAGFGEVDTPYWMAEQSDALFGFVRHREPVCRDGRSRRSQTHLGLARLDMSAFGQRYVAASRDIVRPLPLIGRDRRPMPRFFEDRLIYGSMRGPIRDIEGPINASVVVIDLMQEGADQILPISHTVARIEAGDRTTPVVIGYAGDAVVEFTALDVSGEAELRATVQVEDRVIAESRTHAFNATTYNAAGRDGALMGLATGPRPTRDDDWRWWQRQGEAGVSFLQLEDDDFITLGAADPQNGEVSEAYECEVSCVDWYGVVRAFYLNNRVFALTNTELIEVDLFQGDQLEVLNRTRLDSEPLRQGD